MKTLPNVMISFFQAKLVMKGEALADKLRKYERKGIRGGGILAVRS